MDDIPTCRNCGGWPDDDTLHPVEELHVHRFDDGLIGWEVKVSEWCAACISGAARQGSETIAGRQTYGTDRPVYDQPIRVRFAS